MQHVLPDVFPEEYIHEGIQQAVQAEHTPSQLVIDKNLGLEFAHVRVSNQPDVLDAAYQVIWAKHHHEDEQDQRQQAFDAFLLFLWQQKNVRKGPLSPGVHENQESERQEKG